MTPFLSLSSMNSDKYSGVRWFKLTKYSKSVFMRCLKSLSSLKEARRKKSNLSFRSNRLCMNKMGVLLDSSLFVFALVLVLFVFALLLWVDEDTTELIALAAAADAGDTVVVLAFALFDCSVSKVTRFRPLKIEYWK